MISGRRHGSIRGGVTLIELLVVVSIVVLLAAVALPKMRPAMQGRRVRETTRAVNVYLGSARTRAMETGRPVGVLFERSELNPNVCTVLRQVEIPPPYAGDELGAVVSLQTGSAGLKMRVRANDWSAGLIRRGDLVQLNHQGPLYKIYDDLSDNDPVDEPSHPLGTADPGRDFPCDQQSGFIDFSVVRDTEPDSYGNTWVTDPWLSLYVQPSAGYPWPVGGWSDPVPFQVLRQPSFDASSNRSFKSMSAAKPLQLPRGMVIDLAASGSGGAAQFAASDPSSDVSPVILMFSPSGAIERACFQDFAGRVTSPVFLMVGKWMRTVDPAPEDGLANWEDLTNLWVAIGPQTGLVTVAEPYAEKPASFYQDPSNFNPPQKVGVPPNVDVPFNLWESRTFARQAQISKGGR